MLELANAWIRKPGFPLVRATRQGRKLRLEQERFRSSGDEHVGAKSSSGHAEKDETWPVPVVLKLVRQGASVEQRVLLSVRAQDVELSLVGGGEPEMVILNAGAAGFYRAKLDRDSFDAFPSHRSELVPAERIALLSDTWALVRSGERDIGSFLDLLTGFVGEEDYAVLDEIVPASRRFGHRLLDDHDRPAFHALVATLFGPVLATVGWDAADDEPNSRTATPCSRRSGAPGSLLRANE